MNIDLSAFDGVLDAVYRYESYRQMINHLTNEISKPQLQCLAEGSDKEPNCIDKHWSYNRYLRDSESEYAIKEFSPMPYDSMCTCCKRKQDLVVERKRCKKMFGLAKTAISREGRKMLNSWKDPDNSWEQPYDILEDETFNPLGIKP